MLLCAGDSFGSDNNEWKQYSEGKVKVPIATYVLGPNMPSHVDNYPDLQGCELCHNVTYLGRRGVLTGSSGLTVAYLSGMEGPASTSTFQQLDIDALRTPLLSDGKFQGVDILLTSPWPRGVEKYGIAAEGTNSAENGSELVAQLALSLRPRYHFAGQEGVFYERRPYRNHMVLQESSRHVTRFIGLARVGNTQKKKFLYAFTITPMKHMSTAELVSQPGDVTECPFVADTSAQRAQQQKEERSNQYFYDPHSFEKAEKRKSHGEGGPHNKKGAKPQGQCWFCLGSPEVEKQLVVSIGEHSYVALAKGGLVPDHLLILPIGHHQSIVSAPDEVIQEIDRFKSALRKCFKSQRKVVVFFERNFKSSHLQIQVVPVPGAVAHGIVSAFEDGGSTHQLDLQEIPKLTDLKQVMQPGTPYFYVEIPNGDKLLCRVSKEFPLQFGREVLADESLLNMPERVDWRACQQSKDQDIKDAEAMREAFKSFDFND